MGVKGENTLPDGWEVVPLGSIIADLEAGVSVNGEDRPAGDGEVGVLKVSAVSEGRFLPQENKAVVPADRDRVAVSPRRGDVLVSRSNTPALVGMSVYVQDDHPDLYLPDLLWRLTIADQERYCPRWLNYFLATDQARAELRSKATGTSESMKKLSMASLRTLRLLCPPRTEQVRIATILSAWAKAEVHCTALLDAKRRLRSALHHQMLTRSRGVTGSHPSPWPRRLMGDIVERVRRPVEVQPGTEYREIGIRSHGKGVFHKDPVLGEELGDKAVFWVQPDCLTFNVVFAWEQAVAVTSSAEAGMIASHRFPMYKPRPGLLSLRYALLYLLSKDGKSALELGSPGGAGRNRTLSQEAFNKIAIPLPPFEEQERIADVLSAMDREVVLLRQYLDALRKQKRGLMQLLLTGKLPVPDAVS